MTISEFLRNNPLKCRLAFLLNFFYFLSMIILTYMYWSISLGEMNAGAFENISDQWIAIGIGIALIGFIVLTAFALKSFLKGNKMTQIYFMLLISLSIPVAMSFKLRGLLPFIILAVGLWANISCYSHMHSNNEKEQ